MPPSVADHFHRLLKDRKDGRIPRKPKAVWLQSWKSSEGHHRGNNYEFTQTGAKCGDERADRLERPLPTLVRAESGKQGSRS